MQQRLAVTPDQLKLMSYGPRRDIIAALANDPDLSARDLAARLHRPVTGLYQHLNILTEAGLIRISGQRPAVKKPEALYVLAFDQFTSEAAVGTPEGRAILAEAAARYASANAKRLTRAIESGAARLHTEDANAGFYVLDLQLDRKGMVELQRLLGAFITEARRLRVRDMDDLETLSITVLIAPEP